MKNDLITIIIPAYNAEQYLKNTVNSVQNQTYSNIEIICIDDGSKDSTFNVLKSLAKTDHRIKVFRKTNEGVTLARKFGFEQANGEYIGFVDADDEIDSNMFERLYHNINKYNADISHCGHDIIWLNGNRQYIYNTGRLVQQDKIDGIKSLLSGAFEPGLCNKLYKHTLLQSLFYSDVMDYTIKINEDLLMNYYLFKEADTTVFEDVCLYHYIKREGSASTSEISHSYIWDQINVKKIILSDSASTDYENVARKANLITCIMKYNLLLKLNKRDFDDDRKKIRNLIIKHESDIKLLGKKHRLGAKMIISNPNLYAKLFTVFS